ncbi:MAG TPA: hypothetical protein ENI76_10620, partial [Ignavibacteria bacterium]|nr:hypothetical protein [Ignavibacteria bacterium]
SGENKSTSDIDIAFDDENFTKIFLIEEEINKIKTLTKIDIVNIAKSEDRFKNRVKSTGKVLYSATKKLRAEDRLHNFSKALDKFTNVVDRVNDFKTEGFEDVYLDLIVKRFEFTYEMGWKCLKRYLEFLGLEAKSPRMVFRESFFQGIIKDESVWLDMIEQRDLTSHIYDEFQIQDILNKKEIYKKAFLELKKKVETGIIL